MSTKFFEYSSGTVICENCFKEDARKTSRGEFTGDEAVYPNMVEEIDTPAQCDSCGTQSDDYDDFDVDEE